MIKAEEVQYKKLRFILLHNFLGGIAWGLGVAVGAAVLLGVLSMIGSWIDFVPIVGDFVQRVMLFIENNQPTS